MPLVLANRVQETGTANTTVSFTLTGAVQGFQSFSAVGNGNTTYYSATDGSGNWEVGLGTYSTTGPTLTRTTVYASSNSGSAVTFSGAVNIFVTYPSGKSVNLDATGNVSALGTVASGTWQGSTVGVAYGGTGVTTSSGANSVVLRDANQNITVNRLNQSSTAVTAAGGTTTLTAASTFSQILNGTGGQTFKLPDATTLTNTTTFEFNNNATGTLTITDNAGATVGTISSGGAAAIALLSNGTVGGTWDVHAYIPENVTWGTNSLVLGSTVITGGTWNGGTITSGYGGTGLTTFVGANNALYSTSASALTAGTLPVAAGGTGATATPTNGQLLIGNGTNYTVASLGSGTGISTSTGAGTLTINNTGVTSLAGTSPVTASASTGSVTVSLASGYGDTQNPYASKTANYFLAAPNGAAGAPTFRAIVAADIPTLNQNTTGTAANITASGNTTLTSLSNLATVGTITSGTWSASFGAVSGANLTNLTAGNLTGTIPSTVLGNSSLNVGTTSIALNRASANLALTGISSVTFPGSTSGTIQLTPSAVAGTGTVITMPATTGTMALTSDLGNGTLTMNTSGTGLSGSATFTANQSGATTFTVTSNATNTNTASTIVARDASGNFSAGTITAALSGNASTATTATTASTANALNTANNYQVNSIGVGAAASGTAGRINATTAVITPGTTGVSTGLTVVNGDITTYRTGGTTGVIYLDNTGTKYLYFDGANYNMPGGQLDVNGSRVLNAGNYTSYSPSLTGSGASGTWGISISGNAATATSATSATSATTATTASTANALNASNNYSVNQLLNNTWYNYNDNDRNAGSTTYYPNASTRAVRFFFANASTTGTGGNYAGVMQFNPWDGTTASTGDASYQLVFGSTAANSGGIPQLNIRKGIDSTWNSWYTLLHSGNYNSYSPTLTGTGASGTWGINISGNAATATSATSATSATTATTATNWGSYGAVPAAGTSFGNANTIGRSDANGYTYFNYINSNTSNSENPTVSQFIVTNGSDNFYRKASGAHVVSQLGLPNNYMRAIGYASSSNDWNSLGNTYPNTVEQVDPTNFSGSTNSPSAASYTYGLLVNFSAQSSAQAQMYISHAGNDLIFRGGWGGSSWQTWNKVLTNQNYNSYAPTLTGTGASGTWGINISGNAATATSATSATSATTASTANALNTANNYQVNSIGVGAAASGTAGRINATSLVVTTLSDGTNSTSATNAIQGSAKAWVNFVGSTGTRNASYNVSSVTRTNVGRWTVNFTNALADANYVTTGLTGSVGSYMILPVGSTASAVNVASYISSTGSYYDSDNITVAVFR